LLSAAGLEEGLLSGKCAVEPDSAVPFEFPFPFAEPSDDEPSDEEPLADDPLRA